jgi:hypothetical protein
MVEGERTGPVSEGGAAMKPEINRGPRDQRLPDHVDSGVSVNRRSVLMNAVVSVASVASATAVASPSMVPANHPDAGLLALGKKFDKLADEFIQHSQWRDAAYEAAEAEAPMPHTLFQTSDDPKIGLPEPWFHGDGTPAYEVGDCDSLRKIDHPRARQIVADCEAWRSAVETAQVSFGFVDIDDDPTYEILNHALSAMHDRIIAIAATTLDGLKVKARVAFWAAYGEIEDSESNGTIGDRAAMSVLRDLMQAQGCYASTDREFFRTNPFRKLAAV